MADTYGTVRYIRLKIFVEIRYCEAVPKVYTALLMGELAPVWFPRTVMVGGPPPYGFELGLGRGRPGYPSGP